MFTPEDQQAIIALMTPILEETLTRAVQTAGGAAATTTWRPGTATAVNVATGSARVVVDGDSQPTDLTIIGTAPAVGGRVMVVFVPPSAVFAFAMSGGISNPYVTAIGGWVLGDGVIEGQYQRVSSSLIHYRGSLVVGSTSSFGSALNLRCPVNVDREQWFFGGILNDTSGGVFTPCVWRLTAPNTVTPYVLTGVTQMNNAGLTSAIPWTWATGDSVQWSFDYVPAT